MNIYILVTCLFVCSTEGHPRYHRPKRDEDVAGVTYSACKDTYSQCPDWKRNGMCEMPQYKDYMPLVCTDTCGYCKGVYKARSEISSPTIIDATEHSEGDASNVEAAVNDGKDYTRSRIFTPNTSLKAKDEDKDEDDADSDDDSDSEGDEDLPGDEKSNIEESHDDGESNHDGGKEAKSNTSHKKSKKSKEGRTKEKLTSKSHIDDGSSNKGKKKVEQSKHDDDLMTTKGDTAALITPKASKRKNKITSPQRSTIKQDKTSAKTIITHKSKTSDKEGNYENVARAYTADDNPEPTVSEASGEQEEVEGETDEASTYARATNPASSGDYTEEESGEEKEDEEYEEVEPKQQVARTEAVDLSDAQKIPRREAAQVSPAQQDLRTEEAAVSTAQQVPRTEGAAVPAPQPNLNDFPDEEGDSDDPVDDDEDDDDDDNDEKGEVDDLKVEPLPQSKDKKKKANKAIKEGKITMVLEQNYDNVYQKKDSTGYQLLSGNIKKDIEKMIKGTSVRDIAFSEATVEGNPRRVGKTKVSFNIDSDSTDWMESLLKLVDSGDIDGLRVIKGSLEIEETR